MLKPRPRTPEGLKQDHNGDLFQVDHRSRRLDASCAIWPFTTYGRFNPCIPSTATSEEDLVLIRFVPGIPPSAEDLRRARILAARPAFTLKLKRIAKRTEAVDAQSSSKS